MASSFESTRDAFFDFTLRGRLAASFLRQTPRRAAHDIICLSQLWPVDKENPSQTSMFTSLA
jgi:hypothetical protein